MAEDKIVLRPVTRADIPRLAEIANAANAQSAIHHRIAPRQRQYPLSYYQWRLNIVRQRFAAPYIRTMVAQDVSSGTVLGFASWAVEGEQTALYKRWVGESSWADWLEDVLVGIEKRYCELIDRSVDYGFTRRFVAAIEGSDRMARPGCLHCHLIVVDPKVHARGVGRMLIDWGKELTVREDLPLYLESNLEATGFYEKGGFTRLDDDVVLNVDGIEPFRVPAYVWEGEKRQGRWLERTGSGGSWKWRDTPLQS